jgi:hypothetical protein
LAANPIVSPAAVGANVTATNIGFDAAISSLLASLCYQLSHSNNEN